MLTTTFIHHLLRQRGFRLKLDAEFPLTQIGDRYAKTGELPAARLIDRMVDLREPVEMHVGAYERGGQDWCEYIQYFRQFTDGPASPPAEQWPARMART